MLTQMHATQDKGPLQVEAKKLVMDDDRSFISVKIRQPGDSIVDGINILMRDTAALRVLVSDLDAACASIEAEEDEEAQRSEALKAAIHAALDRHVAERAETWRKPMRALLAEPSAEEEFVAAHVAPPCTTSGCERSGTEDLDGMKWCGSCKADLENYYAAAKAEAR